MTGPPTEKWVLVDVAHNNTRGSSQRLREKREKIRQATHRPSSESDRVRALEQQLHHPSSDSKEESEKCVQSFVSDASRIKYLIDICGLYIPISTVAREGQFTIGFHDSIVILTIGESSL